MQNTASFGLGGGGAAAGGNSGGGGDSISPTPRNRIPSFLFSGTQTASGMNSGVGMGGGSGNYSYGRAGGAMGMGMQGGGAGMEHDSPDETQAKTWPFQNTGDINGSQRVPASNSNMVSTGIAFNDRLRNDRVSGGDQPPLDPMDQQQQSFSQFSAMPTKPALNSSQLVPSSTLRTPSRLPPSKSILDSGTPSVLQLRQPTTPGSFARATPRTSSVYSPGMGAGMGESPSGVGVGMNASKWITIFGFSGDMESQALREFRRHGEIVRTVAGKGNWIHILYRTPLQAQVALYRPWRILSGSDVMVGAVPCTEPEVAKDEDTAVERGFLVASPSTHLHHHQVRHSPGMSPGNQLTPNTPATATKSPATQSLRTPSDMIRRSTGYRTDGSQPMIQTPQKQTGFLDYFTGFYK